MTLPSNTLDILLCLYSISGFAELRTCKRCATSPWSAVILQLFCLVFIYEEQSTDNIQCFEGEVHSRKRKCIPFFSTLPPSFFIVVSCALCWLLALQHRGVWRMGNVIFFSFFNLALASLRMHFFFKPPYINAWCQDRSSAKQIKIRTLLPAFLKTNETKFCYWRK